jgi:class 3 adenylate cyclase
MPIDIPKSGVLNAFAMIVDINGFVLMVERSSGNTIAQFTRDVLIGGVEAVERNGGAVVGFMGDAFYAVLPNSEATFKACVGIAKDVDVQCEYISRAQRAEGELFEFAPGGPSVKIGIEYGWLEVSQIRSQRIGEQPLVIGPAVNHAARILEAGEGNRCHLGPAAFNNGLSDFRPDGPWSVSGKRGEAQYTYYELDLSDIWREHGSPETYWG